MLSDRARHLPQAGPRRRASANPRDLWEGWHLDSVLENQIYENLRTLDCTRIVIAHRISTIARSDLIVVMDEGRFVEMGTHEELTTLRGRYFELARSQSEGSKVN